MAIGDDIDYDLVNKIIKRKSGAGSTVYTVNELYSWLMDEFDELALMDDVVPMSAQTPTAYTIINEFYIQEALIKFLKTGAISTSGYNDEIRTLHCGASGWTNFVSGDIGNTITGATTGDTGTILDYDNATYEIWVRMDAAGDLFDNATEAYTQSGTGAGTATAISTTGEHLFANPYTLGSLEGTPQLYIFQDGERMANTSWFGTGHFDVLTKVTESGVDIDSKKITVFARTLSDLYDHYEIVLTSAGQNAVPLGTSDDLNNQTATGTIEDWQDGTIATIAIAYGFTTPYSYDIGDGNGAQDYECQIDCDGQTLDKVYEVCKWWCRTGSTKQLETNADAQFVDGEEYDSADTGVYANVKSSPLGTFAGGKFFGARSIYFINLSAADAQNFQLIDKAGVTRNPPNYQGFSVVGLVVGDSVTVFESTGSGNTVVDKDQHTMTVQNAGVGTVTVASTIPTDTPAAGTVIVVESTTGAEEVLAYTSYTGAVFTLSGVTGNAYDGSDHAYVPYIYETATGASADETTTIYTSDKYVVTRVRKKGILPFETTGTYASTGYSATAIRTADSVVT